MKTVGLLALTLALAGCLTKPVDKSGGFGAITVPNTNVNAIIAAAQSTFASYGYSLGPSNYPDSISFDKPSGAFGNLMWGSYNTPVTVRAKLLMTPVPGTNDFRLSVKVARVSDAGEAGFEDSTKMLNAWSGEFLPLLRKIQAAAAGAGPGSGATL